MPRAPLPVTSVTHDRAASSTTSKGITPSSSLLRAHAPNQFPPLEFVYPHLSPEVLAGCCEPLLGTGSSRHYLCKSFPGCLSHDPAGVVGCICLFLPLQSRPSPSPAYGSASPNRPAKRLHAAGVSRSSLFLTFRPPSLFATQVSPTAAHILPTQGSCDFYTRAKICTVTSTGIGHTSRPNQAIDGKRTSTFLDLQPCRPLSRDFHPQSTSAFSRRTRNGDLSTVQDRIRFDETRYSYRTSLTTAFSSGLYITFF